jgi:hypothetical protein
VNKVYRVFLRNSGSIFAKNEKERKFTRGRNSPSLGKEGLGGDFTTTCLFNHGFLSNSTSAFSLLFAMSLPVPFVIQVPRVGHSSKYYLKSLKIQ